MRKDWLSSFYLSTRTTTNYTSVESYSYDEQAEYQYNTILYCPTLILAPPYKANAC